MSTSVRPATQVELKHATWTVDALRSVWERQRERVDERIGVIEQALTALGEDRLQARLRADAERAAHMLAGSVGMFGFIDAGDAARELESELARATVDRTSELSALLLRLREGVRGPVTLCGDERAAAQAQHPVEVVQRCEVVGDHEHAAVPADAQQPAHQALGAAAASVRSRRRSSQRRNSSAPQTTNG
jgi:chemotaxis protein histidine kinase CheA